MMYTGSLALVSKIESKRYSKTSLVLEAAILESPRSRKFSPHLAMRNRPARTAAGPRDYSRLNGGNQTRSPSGRMPRSSSAQPLSAPATSSASSAAAPRPPTAAPSPSPSPHPTARGGKQVDSTSRPKNSGTKGKNTRWTIEVDQFDQRTVISLCPNGRPRALGLRIGREDLLADARLVRPLWLVV